MTGGVKDGRAILGNEVRESLSEMVTFELEKDTPNGGTEWQSFASLGEACSWNRKECSVAGCEG